jgi:threonylcarbamoyladenosine tRNA methylthiotransferase MtaB
MHKTPTIAIHTLGCKLNQAESESLTRVFTGSGYAVATGWKADVFIVNTCSVTQGADRKARQQLRQLRKLNPHALIVATGCYAELAGAQLTKYGADLVVGNLEKAGLPQMLEGRVDVGTGKYVGFGDCLQRTRSFIKIQDGCRNFCSYCIVPLLRRKVYSRDMDSILCEIGARVHEGYREVVLTGTEIGSYEDSALGLEALIRRILNETGIDRLHLSSLQPQHMTKSLLMLWTNDRMVRHFHLALQSGSASVLRRMKRRYDPSQFKAALEMIREMVPDASVTTDVIAGFPGETEEEFLQSYDFCARMKFAAMHVFAYSSRPGTVAANLPGKVDEQTNKERSLSLLDLAARSANQFAGKFLGESRPVLWENEVKPGLGVYAGFTNNYIRVYVSNEHKIANTISRAKLLMPANETGVPMVRASTKGNHGEIWGVINEDQRQSHAALITRGGCEAGR